MGLYRSSREATSVAAQVGEDLMILFETAEFDRATVRDTVARAGAGLARGSLLAGAQLKESRPFTVLRLTVEFLITAVAAGVYHGGRLVDAFRSRVAGRLVDAVRTRVAADDSWLDRIRAACSF